MGSDIDCEMMSNKGAPDPPLAEPTPSEKVKHQALLPFSRLDKLLELAVLPVCSLLLPILTLAALYIQFHNPIFVFTPELKKTLVQAAHLYKKSPPTPLSESTLFELKLKSQNLFAGLAFSASLPSSFALLWAYVSWWVPREKLLRVVRNNLFKIEDRDVDTLQPPMPFHPEITTWLALNSIAALGIVLYTMYNERGGANGCGCYTYIDRKGRQVAKCTLESTMCNSNHSIDTVTRTTADQLCFDAQAAKWLSVSIAVCSLMLRVVYKHQLRIQLQHTTPEQREEEKIKEKERKRKDAEQREKVWYRGPKWDALLVVFSLITLVNTAWQWYRDY